MFAWGHDISANRARGENVTKRIDASSVGSWNAARCMTPAPTTVQSGHIPYHLEADI
jgi:hypothetical protein